MLLVAFISLKKAGLTSQEILFEKLNMRCFNREAGILDALFLIIGKDFQLTVSHSDYRSPGTGFWGLRAFYEYSRNARRVLWKLARETHAPED